MLAQPKALSLFRSYAIGLCIGGGLLFLYFGLSWLRSSDSPEMGWIGTFLVFALFLALWYSAFFAIVALMFYLVTRSGSSMRRTTSAIMGGVAFAIASIVAAYFNNDSVLGNYLLYAALAAPSGAGAFYGWFTRNA